MSKEELNVLLVAILTTALELSGGLFPESMAYLAMGSDLHKWEFVKGFMVSAKLATFESNDIQLTERGHALAVKCEAFGKARA